MTNLIKLLFVLVATLVMSANAYAQDNSYDPNPAQPLGPCDFRLGAPPASCATDPTCRTGQNLSHAFISPTVDGWCSFNDENHPVTVTDGFGIVQTVTVQVAGAQTTVSVLAPGVRFYFYVPDAKVYYGAKAIVGSPSFPMAEVPGVATKYGGRFFLTGSCPSSVNPVEAGHTRNTRLEYNDMICGI